jgi:hypothetical protein
MKIFIGVAAHKKYKMPNDPVYFPIQVGSELHNRISGYLQDNEGDNISYKNSSYSELTAVYYIWKSIDSDVKGIVHYRRYLSARKWFSKSLIGSPEISKLISRGFIILPKRRNYFIETNYSHYAHAHNINDLNAAKMIILRKYPGYAASFDKVVHRTWAHMFNMFIMPSNDFDAYSEWLFSILAELETKLNIESYSTQEYRVYGYISEILLDVWLEQSKKKYVEKSVIYLEGQHLLKKIIGFMIRKVKGSGTSHIRSRID